MPGAMEHRRRACPPAAARALLPEGRAPFALMLGGPDRRTLFILTAEWRLADDHVVNLDRLATGPRTGEILALPVEVPGAGRP